jgi:L-ascorbate metabolism protein UlaG (beta-lactamase superfamily)
MKNSICRAVYLGLVLLVLAAMLAFCGCGRGDEPRGAADPELTEAEQPLILTYLGQAAFELDYLVKVLMDPYSPSLGYGTINIEADLVTVSHNHFDHNYVQGGGPYAVTLYGVDEEHGEWNQIVHHFAGLNIYTVGTYHDDREGGWLGKNSIFVVETAGLRLAHLGDLGHPLGDTEKELLGAIDILLIPVGGHYTLTPEEALQVIQDLTPAVAIPMHYRTEHFPERMLGTLSEFLNLDLPYPVVHRGDSIQFTAAELPPDTEIWVMEYRLTN